LLLLDSEGESELLELVAGAELELEEEELEGLLALGLLDKLLSLLESDSLGEEAAAAPDTPVPEGVSLGEFLVSWLMAAERSRGQTQRDNNRRLQSGNAAEEECSERNEEQAWRTAYALRQKCNILT
jgi:hypothetical protein